jgi:hypothetical protein
MTKPIFKFYFKKKIIGCYTEIKYFKKALKDYNTILPIFERKKNGIDNTENESSIIKGIVKDMNFTDDDIELYFPLEYGEAMEELKT